MIFLYGPPGSGKSQAGRRLAEDLDIPFCDTDTEVEAAYKGTVAEIFDKHGEAEFRRREHEAINTVLSKSDGVVSLGGGALLEPENRAMVERRGKVVCLYAPLDVLLERLSSSSEERPLLMDDLRSQLKQLIEHRVEHYASFPIQIGTAQLTPEETAWQIQVRIGTFHVRGMGQGYKVQVGSGGLDRLGQELTAYGLESPVAVVSDDNVAPLYAAILKEGLDEAGLNSHLTVIQAGEGSKTLATVDSLWEAFTEARLERSSTVLALGGGVVGDLAGFAAATYLRGINWVTVPTSLLAMVDASLGGKTGFDLPSGKNLVGAFHPPSVVYADVHTLNTLPEVELRSGMAEVVKHGVIADPGLFDICAQGWQVVIRDIEKVVKRAAAVKVRVMQIDPYERKERAALNFGHTLGHAIEQSSGYQLRHGEAIAIGMVAATRLSERLGIAERGLESRLVNALLALGLPTEIPSQLAREEILQAMGVDKKRSGGVVRFVLPVRIGEVKTGVTIENPEMVFG